ncbi:hypothetical protein [Bacteroides caecigallinarum]|uniref:hypothetical protein n=1 Tax=Bacteroides caecigallinarum TaxID=1411144 RepID=UPI001F318F98|nr:hypothetical protein [Bacteroides caecigallinarum]MCF2583261.1 hypothetical protein [Bacteroides caecigallinarum]
MARLKLPNGEIVEISLNTSKVNNDLSITTERYIVFLDIMGFKDRVARTKHEELLSMLNDFNQRISKHILEHKEHGIRLSQFSDSILIYSSDNKQSSLQTISEVSSKVMETAINSGIPLKGAIAKGVITCDISKQLYFGQALIDAYLLEENVKYYGVLAHNSVEADIKVLEEKGLLFFRDIEAPLKSGTVSHFEICWYKNDIQAAKESLRKIRETVSGDPRKYIDNSLKVIDSFKA